MRGQIGVVFHAQSNGEVMYSSADMEDLPLTWQPVDGFQQVEGQLGIVIPAQSNHEVTIHIS